MSSNKYQHDVPEPLKPEFDAARVRVADYSLPRLSHAERAKTLLAKHKTGILSTASEEDGTPFGSIINFAIDDRDDTIFFLASKLAEHTANLDKDPRASLFVYESTSSKDGDQLAVARVTILGHLARAEKSQDMLDIFLKRHPSANYVNYDDFSLIKFETVSRVRYIAGFGEMSWVSADAYREAKKDEVNLGSAFPVQHMNDDHADSNLFIVNKHGNLAMPAKFAQLYSIDRLGMDFLTLMNDDNKTMVRVLFPEPLESAKQIREAVIKMSKEAVEA